ncbi:unnamed protein product [Macrosiphum euphorbiae]|uniref:Uncharacterized protein n=1 Tax=Macrosiphum euphorbiae TaxID=13131 RepID=A0AAV0WQS5_9HEMI|nr:unnamed protein product [Macrosiphum euphorbiae]
MDLTILTHEELSVKYVCAHHFSQCDIRQAGNRVILIKTAIPQTYNIDNSSYELHQSTSSTPSRTDPLLENTLDTDDEIDINVSKPTHTYLNRSPETPTFYFSQTNSNNT